MALVRHGTIGDFQPGVEDWVSYTERLEQYFTANGIATDAAEQRRAILLSVCGPATYQLIRNLVAPAKPTDKTFAQLVALVKEHQQQHPRLSFSGTTSTRESSAQGSQSANS